MAPSRNTRSGKAPGVGSVGKAQPQNEISRGNPKRRRSPAFESEPQQHTLCSSLGESRKPGQHLDDGSEEGRPRKRARRSSFSTASSLIASAIHPAHSTSSSSTLLLPASSLPTTLYSTSLASTDASGDSDLDEVEDASSNDVEDGVFSDDGVDNGDTDDDEVEDASSNNVEDEVFSNDGVDNGDTDDDEVEDGSSNDLEDEVFSDDGVDNGDIDDDEVELSTTSTAQATETQTNQEIGSSLLQHDRVYPRYTVVDSTFYDNLGEDKCDEVMHNVLARIRLPKKYGGTEKAIEIEILNDTGSSYQCVFEADLEEMEYNRHTYRGHTGKVLLCTCNGVTSKESLWVELQLLKPDGTSFGGWFLEQTAIENMEFCGGVRVTGSQIRKEFYFATTPGKRHLFVAKVAHTA